MARLPGTKRPNPEGRMAVMDHLRELRRRLIWVLIIIIVGGFVAYFFYNYILGFLKGPYCHVPVKYRVTSASDPGGCDLVYHGPLDGFTVHLKVSVIAGMIFTSPLWLYQLWAFVTPGLRKNERKWTLLFIVTSTLLFLLGVVLAYVTLRTGLSVLIKSGGSGTQAQLTVTNYISFVVLVLLVFGVSFELPLIVVLLNAVRVLPYSVLRRSQRVAIFLVFLFAAVATPSTDPFTMTAMAVPMVILFEAAVLWCFFHDRRRARREVAAEQAAQLSGLDDATPSDVDPIPAPLHDQGAPTGGRSDYDDLP